jgi:hypothetical protein
MENSVKSDKNPLRRKVCFSKMFETYPPTKQKSDHRSGWTFHASKL